MLGPDAKEGEINVVEVEAMGYKSDVKYPITVLKAGSQHQSLLDLLFPDPPVTFKLVRGSGPIHLLGNHSVGSKYFEEIFQFAMMFENVDNFRLILMLTIFTERISCIFCELCLYF